MIETRTAEVPLRCPPGDLAQSPGRDQARGRPWRLRLWTLLNAQALIRGAAGGAHDIAVIEDDHRRLARRGH